MAAVAVAVGSGGGNGSRRAVKWAAENLMGGADRFVLVHVIPTISSVPSPSGDRIPVEELDDDEVAIFVNDMKEKLEDVFDPYKKLCKTRQMETVILDDDDPATALLRFVSESGMNSLVLGSCSSNFLTRKLKGPEIPANVLRYTASRCDIHVVSKHKVYTKSANLSSSSDSQIVESFRSTTASAFSRSISSGTFLQMGSQTNADIYEENRNSVASVNTAESDEQAEVEKLREELQSTIAMYKQACEELVHAQNKVQIVSSVCLEETRRVNAALEKEKTLTRIAAIEKEKHLKAAKEVERARVMLEKETYERQIAEVNAAKELIEKRKLVDELFVSDNRYRRYTPQEIEQATGFFSPENVIGEGGYGKVYKCNLDHTPVAIKVLQSSAAEKKQEFLKEVEVLSQLHHPNIVLLVGACPESCCLVYEYMENGSLDNYISPRQGKPQLPWFTRFRIIFEIACGLAFLHYSDPEPIVHRDLKPGNILLDRNYVSKIGDVGLAKLISDVIPDNITEYGDSVIAGTIFYMDPEYQRTGTIRPKSDLFAFGVIILQLLTSRRPKGLLIAVEKAMANGSLVDVLDKSVSDWPLVETEELVRIALECSKLRCRDRPDLKDEILPVLRRLADMANGSGKLTGSNSNAPSHYYCPILQEIIDDPYIAGDGFTYEHRAITAWLDKYDVSPVTGHKLQHFVLTPDHTLRSAINEWCSRAKFPGDHHS